MNRRNFTKLIFLFAVLFPFLRGKAEELPRLKVILSGKDGNNWNPDWFENTTDAPKMSDKEFLILLEKWAKENRFEPCYFPVTGDAYYQVYNFKKGKIVSKKVNVYKNLHDFKIGQNT